MKLFNISCESLALGILAFTPFLTSADILTDFDSIIEISQPEVRTSAVTELLDKSSGEELNQLLARIEAIEDIALKEELLKSSTHQLAREEGQRAVEILYANQINPKDLARTLRLWSIREPQKALNWLLEHREYMGSEYNEAFLKVFTSWSISNSDEATEYAFKIEDAFAQRCAFAYSYIPQVLRPNVSVPSLLENVSKSDLAEEQKTQVQMILLSLWIQRDSGATISWIEEGVADQKAKENLYCKLLKNWGRSNAGAAGKWVTEHSQDLAANSYYAAYAEGICSATPESALAWANAMSEKKFKEETILKLLLKWAEEDKDAARKWVKANQSLSTDEKNTIVVKINRSVKDEANSDRIIGFGPMSVSVPR